MVCLGVGVTNLFPHHLPTLFTRSCRLAAVTREVTSETMMATIRLIMMRLPKMMRPRSRIIVKARERPLLLLELS